MESQQHDSDESLFTRDNDDFSSGPLAAAPDEDKGETDEDEDEDEMAADDELDEDL